MFRRRFHFVALSGVAIIVLYLIINFLYNNDSVNHNHEQQEQYDAEDEHVQESELHPGRKAIVSDPSTVHDSFLQQNLQSSSSVATDSFHSDLQPIESQSFHKSEHLGEKHFGRQDNVESNIVEDGLSDLKIKTDSNLARQEVVAPIEVAMSDNKFLYNLTSHVMADRHLKDIIQERRRLMEEKRKLVDKNIRFQQELSDIMKDFHNGGVVEVRKKPDTGPYADVVPQHWLGLNSTELHGHYPGIVLSKDYVLGRQFVASNEPLAAGMQGNPHTVDDMTDGQVEDRFYQLITELHVDCLEIRRMGSFDDGGWDLCTVKPYNFKPGCLVYSFGINFDFVFDDAMSNVFNCTVKSFDPSMTTGDYLRSANVHFYQLGLGPENTVTEKGWKLMTLKSIRSKLGHSKKLIDVLKIDIDYGEWTCLRPMIADGSLDTVKQLIFEIHTPEVENIQRPSSKEDFLEMYITLSALEKVGFRRYHYHSNPHGQYTSVRTGRTRSCCFELYYINIHFLKVLPNLPT